MTPTTAPAYHHGDLRRVLVAEAAALLAEAGVQGMSLREVARRAGVSQTAPYRHFDGRGGLLAAVAAEGFTSLARHTAERAGGGRSARSRLKRGSLAYVEFAMANPELFRLMFSGPEFHDSTEARSSYRAWVDLVRDAQKAGDITAGAGDRKARYLWSLIHGVADLAVNGHFAGEEWPRLADAAIDTMIRGMGP